MSIFGELTAAGPDSSSHRFVAALKASMLLAPCHRSIEIQTGMPTNPASFP